MRKRTTNPSQRKWHHEVLIHTFIGVSVWLMGSGLIALILNAASTIASISGIAVGFYVMLATMWIAKRLDKGGRNV